MKTIVTHISPDLDAIASTWLIRRFLPGWEEADMAFTPQQEDWNGVRPDSDPDILYTDTGFGKFDHHHLPERTSATKRVFEYLHMNDHIPSKISEAVSRMVDHINEIDHFAEVSFPDPSHDRYEFMLYQIVSGVKKKGISDAKLLQQIYPLLDGVLEIFVFKIRAEKEIQKGFIFQSSYGKSIAMNSTNDESMRLAQKMGYSLVVMKHAQLGFARIKTLPSPKLDLTPVYELIKKRDTKGYWYLHILKNMLLNGSSKTPNAVPTPLSLQELIEIIQSV